MKRGRRVSLEGRGSTGSGEEVVRLLAGASTARKLGSRCTSAHQGDRSSVG